MAYISSHRFARIAPRKARLVADLIRGKPVDQALTELQFTKKRGAFFLRYVLRSAIAQAEQANVDPGRLFVSETRVDEGPTIKRFQPKDRGRSHPIMKRTSHIHVAVDVR
jgi:large subunit ribosomal protein L22